MRFQIKDNEIEKLSKVLLEFFDEDQIEQLGRQTKFIQRSRELTAMPFAKLCIIGVFQEGLSASLGQLCSKLHDMDVDITPQALDLRFSESAVEFMQSLLDQSVSKLIYQQLDPYLLTGFNGVYLQDSTSFMLPPSFKELYAGSGGVANEAGMKIDLTHELQKGSSQIIIKSADTNDHGETPKEIIAGSLSLRDLGYFKLDDIEAIENAGGYYVSRLKSSVSIYKGPEKDADRIYLEEYLNKLEENETMDLEVYLGATKRLKTRLIIQKIPEDVANEKRKNLKAQRNKKAKNISEKRLKLCGLNIYITDVNEDLLNALEVIKVYRIRWQIEIVFKVWKSIYKIDTVKEMKPERMLCQLYGRLILILINTMINMSAKTMYWRDYGVDISDFKAHKILRDVDHLQWMKELKKTAARLYYVLKKCFKKIWRFGKKSKRKGRVNYGMGVLT